ncbi:MAG TPA: post-COAP-1 domain-containing protein, partial [Candidatus Binatia bacterium]|nr:post-COAP-1 domain-containing protein [Candidatus Binatia bacterium]
DCRDITYEVTIDGVPGTAYVIACDNGEPGRNDTFDITLSSGYHAAGDLGGARPGGGNIQLHKCPPGWLR